MSEFVFDFSNYRPGDVVAIPNIQAKPINAENILRMEAVLLAIGEAAQKAGLDWEFKIDGVRSEVRVTFK